MRGVSSFATLIAVLLIGFAVKYERAKNAPALSVTTTAHAEDGATQGSPLLADRARHGGTKPGREDTFEHGRARLRRDAR